MKKILTISLMVIMAGAFMACGKSSATPAAAQPEPKTWPLIADDGDGVLFTSYEVGGEIAAQVKLYDNVLRKILNGDSGDYSAYGLDIVPARIYIFGLKYGDTTIDQLTCDLDNGTNQTLQIPFACYINYSHPDQIIETVTTGVHSCNGFGGSPVGIPAEKIVHMANVPIRDDRTLYCTGGDKTFYVNIFEEKGISTDDFTLFFDFMLNTFRGKMVVTEVGQDPTSAGVAMVFKGLQ